MQSKINKCHAIFGNQKDLNEKPKKVKFKEKFNAKAPLLNSNPKIMITDGKPLERRFQSCGESGRGKISLRQRKGSPRKGIWNGIK
jgi:hypothetical protein